MSTTVPPSQPIAEHTHTGKVCPVAGNNHEWCPPQPGDSRSPCPALNTLANHGYIARDGKNLGVFELVSGLQACYNLSTPLAYVLAVGSFVGMRRISKYDLHYLSLHGLVEHDASLVHHDTPAGEKFAPTAVDQELVEALIADAKAEDMSSTVFDPRDAARARVRREKQSPALGSRSAVLAQGEIALTLGVMETQVGTKKGMPVEWIRELIGHERLPKDWKPTHVQGLFDVIHRLKVIQSEMAELRKSE